jgi:outer membrane protein assembly factor BamB
MTGDCCGAWAVGPDGVAYGIALVSGPAEGSEGTSRITALDLNGMRAGWPISFDGVASQPAIAPDGRIVVTVGSIDRSTSRVLVFDPAGKGASAVSPELPIATADSGVDCGSPMQRPLISQRGSTYVYSWLDDSIFGLDTSLDVMPGWPFEPATPLERPFPLRGEEGINCSSLAVPAVGPDGTLYLPLMARDPAVGGSIVAVGRDGKVRPGWPVGLRRPGSEFWSVAVGSDGTAYALAIEPETGDTSSASILAIAPDSTVLYTTTIVDP